MHNDHPIKVDKQRYELLIKLNCCSMYEVQYTLFDTVTMEVLEAEYYVYL
jgi:hypothetical protein